MSTEPLFPRPYRAPEAPGAEPRQAEAPVPVGAPSQGSTEGSSGGSAPGGQTPPVYPGSTHPPAGYPGYPGGAGYASPGYSNPATLGRSYPPPPPPTSGNGYGGTPGGTPRPRTRWLPLAGTATAAALAASLATAGLVGAFDTQGTPTAGTTTTTQQPVAQAPVSGSTAHAPDWEAVAAAVRNAVVAIDVQTASGAGKGSGVILDTAGHVLTNNHVAGDAVDGGLEVTLADGRVYKATIVGTDPTTDLAVIKLTDPPKDLTPAVIGDSTTVKVGDPVMAVGNPLGLDSTVTTGIVSALDRPVSTSDGTDTTVVTNAIQVDAAVNPGNSGGPLFDATGKVIGITSSIASLSNGSGQAGSIGLGFAIPSSLAQRVSDELIQNGSAKHAFLGVSLGDGTATANGTTRRGAVVQDVTSGSPAGKAGLQQGDVVVAIDKQPVNGAESLTAFVREHAAGETATLTIIRNGSSSDVTVTFAAREDALTGG
ncbi:MAG TPA: trypsin-like peptidase domain-containing protein [Actinotalea sp.]